MPVKNKMTPEDKLWNALTRVRLDAREQIRRARKMKAQKPFNGKSQSDWDKYFDNEIEQASIVIDYCFIRQMQINPD